MISTTGKFKTSKELYHLINNNKTPVFVDGVYVKDSNKGFAEYISELEYGNPVVSTHKGIKYMFCRSTDNTINVFKEGESLE